MKVTLLLADAAQVADGKLNVLGAGWLFIVPNAPSAVALLIDVPWDGANRPHNLSIRLVSEAGEPVAFPDQYGTRVTLQIDHSFEVGRPPGTPPGSDLRTPFAVNISPLPLQAGHYEWRVYIDGETRPEWGRPFTVRKALNAP